MTTLKIDSQNDLELVNNDLGVVTGRDEIGQILRHELRVFFGEWFLDESIGVPYYEEIFVKGQDLAQIDAILKEKILNTPGVVELIAFALDLNGREASLSFTARTTEGIIDFSEVLS